MDSGSENGSVEGRPLLAPLIDMKVDGLKRQLEEDEIPFEDDTLKSHLQALWALRRLGFLAEGGEPDHEDIAIVAAWCTASATKLANTLGRHNLQNVSSKWKRAQILMEDQLVFTQSLKIFGEAEPDNSDHSNSVEDSSPDLSVTSEETETATADPDVANLLISLVFGAAVSCYNLSLLPGFPVTTVSTLQRGLDDIPQIGNAETLATALDSPPNLLRWIYDSFGEMLVPATGDLKIEGMPSSVRQLVVTKQLPELQANSTSASIIASDPSDAYGAAFKLIRPNIVHQEWKNTPFGNCGILLGCEVAGVSMNPPLPKIATINQSQLGYVLFRYVFIIESNPSESGYRVAKHPAPKRRDIEHDMNKGFNILKTSNDELGEEVVQEEEAVPNAKTSKKKALK
ncbi:hypothetical protein G7Y89_g1686 [Cudoniella acicularis]|uniref:Uncharacterized protein n=1 Tax=Cudoniella acicularis TaxID=354080 RepID=A0A8H4RWR5_9HELO|nr:hypothetical protein G7Y89_g1686 [Cudoniella acicularis]